MNIPSLSTTLLVNAALSAAGGSILLLAGQWLAPFLGTVPGWIYQAIGIELMLFGVAVYRVYQTLPRSRPAVIVIFALDLLWVIATPVVMVVHFPLLNTWAQGLLAATAIIVSVFALLEWYWWSRPRSDKDVSAPKMI